MNVREPFKYRKAMLAGVVALALTGTGVAVAWAASDSGSPSPSASQSQSAPGQDNGRDKNKDKAKPDKSQRPQHLHSESVVKKADGTFQTILEQHGTVEAVSDSSITVKSEDGYSQAYTVNAETKVRPSIADIATGDAVRISGVKNGDQATAERIVEGAGDGPGLGMGRGHGHGKGHNK
ncbi:conserved exported hypothetical protein [Arthrobacter sp. 9AX]|uniref:DUF5666 domain-containing protein n=1 Tax=Arthrobacter sp. 9AX TaxID=2653131 RepID=UPI0012EFE79B|nr:DUF5666 domain-containing protein [Arthrobacter sp. 9AX]VXC63125.1 conserved exported hypothetical protein [Arthrobacter sp. 9AX]